MKTWMVWLFVAICLPLLSAQEHRPQWSYEGATGPEHWGTLRPEYSLCETGKQQSPIDIAGAVSEDLPPIEFHYQPAPLKLIDNGHTVQVNYPPGSYINIAGKKYELVQFHFHHPSEEEIAGKQYALVIHLVHKDSEGHLAVVAVLFQQGTSNAALKTLVDHLPQIKERESATKAEIDAASLLPAARRYYTVAGSLTTPPCTEGVTWFVLQTPSELSGAELSAPARLYPHNSRPIQPLNGRTVSAMK